MIDLLHTLKTTFGYSSFRPLQREIIEATLAEADDALAPYVTRTPDGSVSFATSALVLRATAA